MQRRASTSDSGRERPERGPERECQGQERRPCREPENVRKKTLSEASERDTVSVLREVEGEG